MKKIVHAHIECLSDSHFKVIGSCLDSLIAILSFDSSFILPKIDLLIFKVNGFRFFGELKKAINFFWMSNKQKVLNNLIDTKDVVSSRANFLVNVISKIFPAEKLIDPI